MSTGSTIGVNTAIVPIWVFSWMAVFGFLGAFLSRKKVDLDGKIDFWMQMMTGFVGLCGVSGVVIILSMSREYMFVSLILMLIIIPMSFRQSHLLQQLNALRRRDRKPRRPRQPPSPTL